VGVLRTTAADRAANIAIISSFQKTVYTFNMVSSTRLRRTTHASGQEEKILEMSGHAIIYTIIREIRLRQGFGGQVCGKKEASLVTRIP
jgi:hypothetical protein